MEAAAITGIARRPPRVRSVAMVPHIPEVMVADRPHVHSSICGSRSCAAPHTVATRGRATEAMEVIARHRPATADRVARPAMVAVVLRRTAAEVADVRTEEEVATPVAEAVTQAVAAGMPVADIANHQGEDLEVGNELCH